MEDLKQYKKVWKNQTHTEDQLDSNEISKMIHKKSSSTVKWIFYISIAEFIVLTLINIFGTNDLNDIKEMGLYNFFIVLSIISYIVPVFFIYLFYKNYKNISVTNSTKGLINTILKTRQTVKYYIVTSLVLFAFAILYGFSVTMKSTEYIGVIEKFGDNGHLIVWSIVILFTIISIAIFLLIYMLLYGILLKKLHVNYKELMRN